MNEILLQILISLATAIFGFIVGCANNKLNLRREIQKERFENLYMPFVKLYDTTHMARAYNFSDFSKKIKKQYIELLVNNMAYATPIIREYIIQLMMIYNERHIQKECAKEDIEYLNKTFNSICTLMFTEYSYYGNKLYYNWFDIIRNYCTKKKFIKYKKQDGVKDVFV